MLTKEENELLCRVGPGTPMGELFRRFWLPALLPEELPTPDCPPIRVRLLGEDLVAFRDTSGRVGLLGEHCAHRGASLFFGRNEECGLRCVYHGWKYDAEGQCVDMPNEPPETNFTDKIHHIAYQAREWGGLIWAYLGSGREAPDLPQLEWAVLPSTHRKLGKWIQDVNYLQCLEGEIDTSHISFLHSYLNPTSAPNANRTTRSELTARDRHPRLFVRPAEYGFFYGSRRSVGDGTFYWRVTQWLLPTYSLIPSFQYPGGGRVWTPIDDEHTIAFTYSYHPERALTEQEAAGFSSGRGFPPELIPGSFYPKRNSANDYLIDRDLQRATSYTGIYGINDQDRAMLDSMGPIVERREEHLGTADTAVSAARKRLLDLAQELQMGTEPAAARKGSAYRVRALDVVSPEGDIDRLMAEYQSHVAPQLAIAG